MNFEWNKSEDCHRLDLEVHHYPISGFFKFFIDVNVHIKCSMK